jgi:UPF0271 protein
MNENGVASPSPASPMTLSVDLNSDLGEGFRSDRELLTLVTSASIACGIHAGDPATMMATIAAAKEAGVAVGAHPGLADREHFGRRELQVTADEVFALVAWQVGAFAALAHAVDVTPQHVKPHGALYNMAARDPNLADAVVRAIVSTDSSLVVFAPAASELAEAASRHGLRVAREFFADRNYLPDGTLVPRSQSGAVLHDPASAAARVLRLLREGMVRSTDGTDLAMPADTICLHGDTPEAINFTLKLRTALLAASIRLSPIRASAPD